MRKREKKKKGEKKGFVKIRCPEVDSSFTDSALALGWGWAALHCDCECDTTVTLSLNMLNKLRL